MKDTRGGALPRGMAWVILAGLAFLLGACATGQGNKSGTDYVGAYKAGRYSQAYEGASRAATSLRGTDKQQASLIAGLSAQALDRNDDAVRWLKPLATSTDSALCGKSCAALGLISQERGQHQDAVDYLMRASTKLPGDEGARAMMYAGDSMKAMGDQASANRTWEAARERVQSDVQLRVMIGDRLAGIAPHTGTTGPGSGNALRGWSVQVGAFADAKKADAQARQMSRHGATRVVLITGRNGTRLYAVRIGRFVNRDDADQLRRRIGSGAVVVNGD